MKPIKFFYLIVVIAIITACSSCDNSPFSDCKDDYYFVYNFDLRLYDYYSKENLLEIGVNKYHKDTVKIYEQNWKSIFDGPVYNNGSVIFSLVNESDFGVANLSFHKEFFLYLNQYDTDTLVFDFTMDYNAECKEQEMIGMRIEYNDSVYFDKPNAFIYYMDFYKK
jgi:hypothetical protein